MNINEKIEYIRKKKGVTKQHIANKCGYSSAWYTDLLKGRPPRVDTLQKIADALDVPVTIFFKDDLSVTHKKEKQAI